MFYQATLLIAVFSFIVTPFGFLTLDAKASYGNPKIRVAPHIMPDNHPIKEDLDKFFGKTRVTFNEKTLKNGGFSHCIPRKFSRVVVAKHPLFPGYVFKIYLDVQRYYNDKPEWELWAMRCEGANLVRQEIAAMGYEEYMKTPVKWIYPLPIHPKPPKGYLPKHYILVQEDMDLLSSEDNIAYWKSDEITFEDLDRVYYILKKVGLYDCAKVHNVPFAKDGSIAFIDTQTYNAKKVSWSGLNNYLNAENKAYWLKITGQKQ